MNSSRNRRRLTLGAIALASTLCFGCARSGQQENSNGNVAQPPGKAIGGGAVIERKTFSMTLPEGWTEDVNDDMHDPDAFVFFENQDSCLVSVVIGKKSAGASVEQLLLKQKETWQGKVSEAKTAEFERWGNYAGRGFEIEGMVQGITRARTRIFGFQNGDNACVVSEFADLEDVNKYAGDFETIRQSFKLK